MKRFLISAVILIFINELIFAADKDEGQKPLSCGDSWIDSEGNEVVVICGSAPECEINEVEIDGFCLPRGFFDFACEMFFVGCGISVPDPTPDPGGGVPPTPKPTIAKCNSTFDRCAARVARDQRGCEFDRARIAGIQTGFNKTCHGNDKDLIESITVVGVAFGASSLVHSCTVKDLQLTTQVAKECQRQFRQKAMEQCMFGFKGSTVSSGMKVDLSFDDGFAKLGIGGTSSVAVQTPPGAGITHACAAWAEKATAKCVSSKAQCIAKATGTSLALGDEEPIEAILSRIDKKRLGFPTLGDVSAPVGVARPFRDLGPQGPEPNELRRARLNFLADWSTFLTSHATPPLAQKEVQIALQGAQRQYKGFRDDFLGRTILVWLVDPETGEAGSEEARGLLEVFEKTGGFQNRIIGTEASLMAGIADALGPNRMEEFKRIVWPGINSFGSSTPMRASPQQVSPVSP